MQARDVMTRSVITVRGRDSIHRSAELMTTHRVTSLPVLDDDDRVVGIVSEADVIRDRMPSDPRSHLRPPTRPESDPSRQVWQVMTNTVVCLAPGADTADIAAVMLDDGVRAIPIVDGVQLVGIVARRDLLRTLLRPDAATTAELTDRLAEYSGEPGRWKVGIDDGVVSITGRFDDAAQERIVTGLARTVPGVLRVHTHHHR